MKSVVVAVLERNGGYRIVIELPHNLKYHVKDGESVVMLPDVWVDESQLKHEDIIVLAVRMEDYLKNDDRSPHHGKHVAMGGPA